MRVSLWVTAALCLGLMSGCDDSPSPKDGAAAAASNAQEAVEAPSVAVSTSAVVEHKAPPYKATDVGGGVELDLGATQESLKTKYPDDIQCLPQADESGVSYCFISTPTESECPILNQCSDIAFEFQNGHLTGFTGTYDEDLWLETLQTLTTRYGKARLHGQTPKVVNMGSEVWGWQFPRGCLSEVKFTGTSMKGEPIAHPYNIGYSRGTCKAALPSVSGKDETKNSQNDQRDVDRDGLAPANRVPSGSPMYDGASNDVGPY